jgi:TonB family protein
MTADRSSELSPADEIQQAERWMRGDPRDRRRIAQAFAAAIVLHVVVLVARVPGWSRDPVRVDAPAEQSMQVEFLKPPAAPAAKPAPKPKPKAIPRPDPTPEEPEPVVEEPAPPPTASTAATPQPAQTGPVRVAPGQGPGLIKRVEPRYPPLMQAAQREGVVTLDAVIFTNGTVGEVKVLSSPHPSFAEESVRAVQQWRFSPPQQDVILTVTVRFTLRR